MVELPQGLVDAKGAEFAEAALHLHQGPLFATEFDTVNVRSGSSTTGEMPPPAGRFAADSRRCRPSGCFVALT
jgi:hypothetical protein